MDYLLNKMVCMLGIHQRGHTTCSSPYTVPGESLDYKSSTRSAYNKLHMASVSPWFYNYGGCETVKGDYEGPNLWIQRLTKSI